MTVHVSIHDVTPRWATEVEILLDWCSRRALQPALLVVPNYHHQWPLNEHPSFCERLRELQGLGHSILLHGFYHDTRAEESAESEPSEHASSGVEPWGHWVYQRLLSSNEAEFAQLTERQARRLLDRGQAMFDAIGLHAKGFVAPAWSMSPAVRALLRAQQCRYSEDHLRIYDYAAQRAHFSLLINYATRSFWRMASTVAFARVGRLAAPLAPVRVALHPGDLTRSVLHGEIKRLLDWAAARSLK